MHAALRIFHATKLAEFGPTFRDREIFFSAEAGEPVERIARRFGLAVRTVKNVVNVVRDRLARELLVWRRMTLDRLWKKEERLRRLIGVAQTGWRKPVTKTVVTAGGGEHTTTRPGRPEWRLFAAAERITVTLAGLELYIEQRMAEEERRGAGVRGDSPVAPQGAGCPGTANGAIRSAGLMPAEFLNPAPAEVERQEVAVASWQRRVGRRKSLSGRKLRVPRFVRARSARRSACDAFLAWQACQASKTWVYRTGIPPPATA